MADPREYEKGATGAGRFSQPSLQGNPAEEIVELPEVRSENDGFQQVRTGECYGPYLENPAVKY